MLFRTPTLRCDALELRPLTIRYRRPFRIAGRVTESASIILCRLVLNGQSGYGAAHPVLALGQTAEMNTSVLVELARELPRRSFPGEPTFLRWLETSLACHPSVRAALETAYLDWKACQENVPLRRLLGYPHSEPTPTVTAHSLGIESDPDETLRQAENLVSRGFRTLKLKLGQSLDTDSQLARRLRQSLPDGIELLADANGHYSPADALALARVLADLNFALFEQPVSRDNPRALAEVAAAAPLPIYADESAVTPEDIRELCQSRAVSGIVVKILKHGGVLPARAALRAAREAGLGVLISCYSDTSLTNAAAWHLHQAEGGAASGIRLDLDSHLFTERDPFGLFTPPAGPSLTIPSGRPGLGWPRPHPGWNEVLGD